jgi:hypothetical protein
LGAENPEVAKQTVRKFMKEKLKITNTDFMHECEGEITKVFCEEFKSVNNKLTSTYRKKLTECEFLDDDLTMLGSWSALIC